MTPVISPWLFYLMSVADDIDFIASGILFFGLIGLLIFVVINSLGSCDLEDFIDNMTRIKPFLIGITIATLVGIVTPSGETITKMLIAQNVTYERVEAATDTVETVYNDIMALFEDNNSEGETE